MDRYDTCASDNKCYMYKDIDHAPSKHFGSIRCKIHNYEIKYYLYPMSLEKTVHTGDNILIKIMPFVRVSRLDAEAERKLMTRMLQRDKKGGLL